MPMWNSDAERAMCATLWDEGYAAALAGRGPDANPFRARFPGDTVLSIGGNGDLFEATYRVPRNPGNCSSPNPPAPAPGEGPR